MSDGGRHRLWSVDAATGAVRSLARLGDDTRWVTVAPRGGRIVYGKARWRFGIRRYRLDTGESAAVPGLSSTFYDGALDLSPDGGRLALVSTRSGSFEVWSSDLEGRRPVQLTSFGGALVGQPRWLPDGRSIVFHAEPEGRSDLWTVAVGEAAPRALTGPPGDHRAPSLSRDGAMIYFASSRSGDWQVWRMPAGGGPAERVTRRGGYLAQESADGAWLYYTRWQAAGLWRVPREGGPEERVLGDELAAADWGNWAPAREGIYFVTWGDDGSAGLALYSPERGEVLRRIPLEGVPVQPSLTLAPEGDAAYLAELDRIESDLVLVEGAGLDGPGR